MSTTHPAELNNGVWTSWLPLSTAWPSQSACGSAAWVRVGLNSTDDAWPYLYDPAYGESIANTPTCLPPQATEWWNGGSTVSNSITSYSIGPIVCPEAYETVSTINLPGSSTSVICCPTYGFVRNLPENPGIDGVCKSTMTSGQSLTYAEPATNSFTSATTTFTEPVLMIAVPVEGYNFATPTTTSTAATVAASSSPKSNPGTSGTATSAMPMTSTSPAEQTGGLSNGAKIGIGVTVGVVAIAFTAIAAWLFFRRRRQPAAEEPVPIVGPAEMAGNSKFKSLYSGGADKKPLMPYGSQPVSEVDGSSRPAELYG